VSLAPEIPTLFSYLDHGKKYLITIQELLMFTVTYRAGGQKLFAGDRLLFINEIWHGFSQLRIFSAIYLLILLQMIQISDNCSLAKD
jgi:hypothetical protein